jgi:biopolymer transport protein ExbD
MKTAWFKQLVQIAPWLTLVLLIAMFLFLQAALAPAPSVAFELPEPGAADSVAPGLVALVVVSDVGGAQNEGVLLFFDDDRYVLSDSASMEEFATRLANRASDTKCNVLTLLCDKRVPTGDVMRIMAIARRQGLAHVQLAEKREG